MRGEKREDGEPVSYCPRLQDLDPQTIFQNRDLSSLNFVFFHIYDTTRNEQLYVYFIHQYVYQRVIEGYWRPINYFMCFLTIIGLAVLVGYINHHVIGPIREMFLMTDYILNHNQSHVRSERRTQNFQKVIKKIRVLERRLLIRLEQDN